MVLYLGTWGRRVVTVALLMALLLTSIASTALGAETRLRDVHVYDVVWKGDERFPEELKFTGYDFVIVTWERIDGRDSDGFLEMAGTRFTLRAAGHDDVIAEVTGGFSTRTLDGFGLVIVNRAAMVPDVSYELLPPGISDTYRYLVDADLRVSLNGSSGGGNRPEPAPEPDAPSRNPLEYGSDIDPNYDASPQPKFSDVPSDFWAYDAIDDMSKRGVLGGYPDGMFRPERTVTRAELAKIMVLAAGLPLERVDKTSFADVKPTDWHAPFVEAAKFYLNGYALPDGSLVFDPDAPALREDVTVAIVKLKGYDETRFPDFSLIEAMFADHDGISAYAKNYVAIAVESKLVSGFPDGTFRAQMPVNRAQAAAMLYRAFLFGSDTKTSPAGERMKVDIPITLPPEPREPSVTEDVYAN